MKKLRKISRIRKEAWDWFSKWVRIKDSDERGMVQCFTCDVPINWKYECHAGHFKHGLSKPTYIHENNVRPQCKRCNRNLSGNLSEYGVRLAKQIGLEELDKINTLSHTVDKGFLSRDYYEAIIERYKKQFEEEVEKRKCRVSEN